MSKDINKTIVYIFFFMLFITAVYLALYNDNLQKTKAQTLIPTETKPQGTKQDFLYRLATDKLNELIATDYWDHTNQDGCDLHCRSIRAAIETNNASTYDIGENLYHGSCSVDEAMNLWHKSPTHEEILKKPYEYAYIAIGHKNNSTECYIVYDIIESSK